MSSVIVKDQFNITDGFFFQHIFPEIYYYNKTNTVVAMQIYF